MKPTEIIVMSEERKWCPLIQKKCVQHKCAWYINIQGSNPNTGEQLNTWDCSIAWIPVMQIETSQKANQAAAAVESFRNEMVDASRKNQEIYTAMVDQATIIPANITPFEPPMLIDGEETED